MTNETAVEKLVELLADGVTVPPIIAMRAEKILAAIQSDPMAYVKPKPLEYRESFTGPFGDWYADRGAFTYHIADSMSGFTLHRNGKLIGTYETLEAAQAAAYEDLCKRVGELF